jgi:hypothetical protein
LTAGATDKCESLHQALGLAFEYDEGLTDIPQQSLFVSKMERWLR